MANVKVTILYYSSTGTNYQMAQWAAEGVKTAGGEPKIVRAPELAPEEAIAQNPAWKKHYDETKDIVPEVTMDDLDEADAILFSIPTRFGNVPAQIKQVMDQAGGLWAQGKLMNKVVSAMSSAQNPHGGQEQTITNLYTSAFHWGCIVAAPGYSDPVTFGAGGNPYGTSVTVDQDGNMKEDVEAAVKHQAKRTAEIAGWVKQGQQQ
ncbi:NAD(P)H:quinone oxidoreductase [Alteribacillus sp. HJP-4]|uniref:NAD(P)H:quinone oxidoreductase n=1 Tax=Alteribacillus sp. HJP-4 TaxID=2775394 RepID=UPI0035CD23AF